eukprot:TRINITY_DN34340_c0_g2_i1.p1 TRINITY_DN34340_c0_g2~~TRINITY_DN34340_c0_g2_i1.p1  ORF type:complete len:141 (-),score=9.94 TRINITY_DN34340_c0_g2_i1:504-926(-)
MSSRKLATEHVNTVRVILEEVSDSLWSDVSAQQQQCRMKRSQAARPSVHPTEILLTVLLSEQPEELPSSPLRIFRSFVILHWQPTGATLGTTLCSNHSLALPSAGSVAKITAQVVSISRPEEPKEKKQRATLRCQRLTVA